MMNVLYSVLLLCSMIAFAVGYRECYECQSYSSWSDCESSIKKVRCSWNYDDCAKLKMVTTSRSTGAKRTMYFKGCTETCDKNNLAVCQNTIYQFKYCDEYHCCNSDYCNAGSRLAASLPFGMLAFATTATAIITSKMMM